MPETDPLQRWLDDFRGNVDESLSRSSAPASVHARDAQEAFENWWRAEQEPVGRAPTVFPEPPKAAAPARENEDRLLPPDWPAQVERLAYEKASLERQLAAEAHRARELDERISGFEKERALAAAAHSREKEKIESDLGRQETRLGLAEEQVRSLRENKALLEQSLGRLSEELTRANEQLALEREKGLLAERQAAVLTRQVAELESERAKLRETVANHAGAIEELRRQASAYQQRLIEAKELTDADIALMRQDLKLFMEELYIIRNTIKKGE